MLHRKQTFEALTDSVCTLLWSQRRYEATFLFFTFRCWFIRLVGIWTYRSFSPHFSLFGSAHVHLIFTTLFFALVLVRFLAVGAVRVVGCVCQSIGRCRSFASLASGWPSTSTAHFRLIVTVQQGKQVTKLLFLSIVADLLHLLQRLLHTLMREDFDLRWLLFPTYKIQEKET